MKQRFSSLDVKVIANELNATLTTLRVSNIYDLSSRIFLFKCAKPGSKAQLLVDSGFRCHLTAFSRTANPTPSAFVSKLRKFLKSRRITQVSQLGTDRVIEISFSDGQYKLFLEFFAAGNIVLTDSELTVLALIRQVSEGNEDVDVRLGGKYVLEAKQNFHGIQPVTKDRVKSILEKHIEKAKHNLELGGKKAKRQKGIDDLRRALSSGFSEYPLHLLEHVFSESRFDASITAADVLQSDDLQDQVVSIVDKANQLFQDLGAAKEPKGYIIAKQKDHLQSEDPLLDEQAAKTRDQLRYEDFHPFRPHHLERRPDIQVLELDGFNNTVDEFYSSIESQQLESRLTEKEEIAKRKLQAAKKEHEKRLGVLQRAQELHIRKAQTIEANTHRVEEATAAVNGLVGQGMDWIDIGKLIENEQKRNNVVAQMIKLPLKLHENTVTLLLDEPGADEESDSEYEQTDSEDEVEDETSKDGTGEDPTTADKRLAIDVDLGLSPWANAREYYDQKKTAAVKEQKTIQASTKALQSMARKTEIDLKKGLKQEKAALRPARKQIWFEKFLYFISSDGYLVLGGKDAQQNEVLYRRYLKKGDIYVHADLQGASSVIVKNNPADPDAPIPPSTLSQAGALTVCTSSAWDSKAVMAAWWVKADQVSKTAPTGEYIKTGGFMIKGKKNFLPPAQLILGFGIMWLISEKSRANHGKHRLQRTESMLSGEAEALAADSGGLSLNDDDNDDDDAEEVKELENITLNAAAPVADVEDSGTAALEEIAQDSTLAHESGDDEDGDDQASVVGSEAGAYRRNPLQANGTTNEEQDKSQDDPESHSDEDEESESGNGEPTDDRNSPEPLATGSSQHTSQNQQAQKQPRAKRGRNTKAKRAAREKYALQTEEERELAMTLLGSTKGEEKREAEEIARRAREEKSKADKERRRQQHERAAEIERKRAEKLAQGDGAEFGGDGDDLEDDESRAEQIAQERKELLNIDLLVPFPEPGDELIAAVPVVAPWTAMARHKYKVKLQPGSLKKGKAVKEMVGNWTALGTRGSKFLDETNRDKEKVWAREVDCIKAWKVEEIVGVVPVKGVRIVTAGGSSGGNNNKGKGGSNRGGKGGKRR